MGCDTLCEAVLQGKGDGGDPMNAAMSAVEASRNSVPAAFLAAGHL